MPGMDGLELLVRMKQINPDLPVIMISGHATIATAVKATRLGAVDFIEKPLDLNATLSAVKRSLGMTVQEGASVGDPPNAEVLEQQAQENIGFNRTWEAKDLNRVAFQGQRWRGKPLPQRTLARTGLLYGQGLHSGKKSGLILEPLPPDSGIHFIGVSETTVIPAHVDFVGTTGFATTLRLGDMQAGTTEHLMATLHAYGISNLMIKCNGEVPVMDGSAREFCALFDAVGTEVQEGSGWYEIEIRKPLEVRKGAEFIRIEPADHFSIEYTLEYPAPLGRQHFVYQAGGAERFKEEIAAARTFGFVKDITKLQSQGLALGGRFDNFVLIGEDGAINDTMRYENEPVRHKILDVMGDLYLLGRPLRGRVVAQMTGHSDNVALLKCLCQELRAAAD